MGSHGGLPEPYLSGSTDGGDGRWSCIVGPLDPDWTTVITVTTVVSMDSLVVPCRVHHTTTVVTRKRTVDLRTPDRVGLLGW